MGIMGISSESEAETPHVEKQMKNQINRLIISKTRGLRAEGGVAGFVESKERENMVVHTSAMIIRWRSVDMGKKMIA